MRDKGYYWYWQQEFRNAYEMLLDMLYKVKGYSHSDEISADGKNQDMQDKLIEVRSNIKADKRKGILAQKYQEYAVLIYKIIRV